MGGRKFLLLLILGVRQDNNYFIRPEETDHHFAGQPISGVVTSLTPCSHEPDPSMEVSPSCS